MDKEAVEGRGGNYRKLTVTNLEMSCSVKTMHKGQNYKTSIEFYVEL